MTVPLVVVVDCNAYYGVGPNGRLNVRRRKELKQDIRNAAAIGFRASLRSHPNPRDWENPDPKGIVIDWHVYYARTANQQDDDNLTGGAFKFARDQFAREMGVDDKYFRTGEVEHTKTQATVGYFVATIRRRE